MGINQKLLKEQIKTYNAIVTNDVKNADVVVDFIFKHFELFFKNIDSIGISEKTVFKFIQNYPNIDKKTDSFIEQLSIEDFNKHESKIISIINNRKSKSYNHKKMSKSILQM